MNSLQAAGFPFAIPDLTNAWVMPKFPSSNIEALLEVHRKNAAALTKANQVLFDGLKTFAQRERDLFKSVVDDYTKVTKDVLAGATVEERATKQADGARHIYASSVGRLLELSDIAVKTNVSAVDILNVRVSEVFDEFRALFAGRGAPATTVGSSITVDPIAVDEEAALIEDAFAAISPTAIVTPPPAPKIAARSAKAALKTSTRTSKASSKPPARAAKAAARRRTSRR